MKFNINLDWAVITSIFTLFLFWCGYWYLSGYASFYNYSLDVFDLPLSTLLMKGLLIGINYVLYLILTLIALSFLLSIDRADFSYLLSRILIAILNIWLLFYYLYRRLLKSKARPFIKRIGKKSIQWLRPYVRSTIRLDTLLGLKSQRYLKKHRLDNESIKNHIYGSNPTTASVPIEVSLFIHHSLIIIVIYALLALFTIGQEQAKVGTKVAKENFIYYSNLPKVEIPNNKSTDLANTGLCFKGSCLITDSKKTVHLQEMKDVKVSTHPKISN